MVSQRHMSKVKVIDPYSHRTVEWEPRTAWIQLFDPATSPELRIAIKAALRDVIGAVDSDLIDRHYMPKSEIIPKGAFVVAIMTSAIDEASFVYSFLRRQGLTGDFVITGYSHGLYKPTKVLSDGSTMNGKFFITQEDLTMLQEHRESPMVLVDNVLEGGRTLGTVVATLRDKIEVTGPVFYKIGIDGPFTRLADAPSQVLYGDSVEISTENGPVELKERVRQ